MHRLLTERGADVTVVDLNLETVRELRERGVKAVYGDVLRAGTLDEAGIATAASLVLSADVDDAAEIVRQARLLNPELRVLARCAHLRDAAALRARGRECRGGRRSRGRRRSRRGGDRGRRTRSGAGVRSAGRVSGASVRRAARRVAP